MEEAIAAVPGVRDVTSDLAITSPQVEVDIDRDKAAALAGERQHHRERVLRCVRAAVGLDDLRRHQRIRSAAGTEAASIRPIRTSLSLLYFKGTGGPADSAGHAGDAQDRTSGRRPSITSASCTAVTISFDLKPGVRAGRSGRRRFASHRRPTSCPPPSATASRARPRRSKARSATCGCC